MPRSFNKRALGDEFQVNAFNSGNENMPSVASLSTGDFVIAWTGNDENNFGIRAQLFNRTGDKIGAEFQVNTYFNGYQGISNVAGLTNSNFVVTWTSEVQDGSSQGIFGQLFNSTAEKVGAEFQVNTFTDGSQSVSSTASLMDGSFVVEWRSSDSTWTINKMYGQLYDSNADRVGTEFQANTYTAASSIKGSPSVASLIDGNFVMTWLSGGGQDSSNWGVFAQLFNGTAARIDTEFQVNTYTYSDQSEPSVASLTNGNFVVVWQSDQQDGSYYGIFGQLFNSTAGRIGAEFQVNTYTYGSQLNACVTGLTTGGFVVVWESNRSGYFEIFGQLFDSNSGKISTEFKVNSYHDANQQQASVASLMDGRFVVTWQSDYISGYPGIYARILDESFILSSSPTPSVTATPSSSNTPSPSSISIAQPDSNRSKDVIAIIAGAVGGSALLLGFIGFGFWQRQRRNRSQESQAANVSSDKVDLPVIDNVKSQQQSNTTKFEVISHAALPKASNQKDTKHVRIKDRYDLINKIDPIQAKELLQQTGIEIAFESDQKKQKVIFDKLHLAFDITTHQFVSVKKIRNVKSSMIHALEIAKNKAVLQQKLSNCSNIMPILDLVEIKRAKKSTIFYQFMPLAGWGNGCNLAKSLKQVKDKDAGAKVLIHAAQGLLTGISQMHQKNIYHLDIKPSNVVFDKHGYLYVTNFDCALELQDGLLKIETVTNNHSLLPEILINNHNQLSVTDSSIETTKFIDAAKMDAWAVGVTLLEWLIGQYPFDQTSFNEKIDQWDSQYFVEKLSQIEQLKNPADDSLEAVIKGLLDLNPQSRLMVEQALQMPVFKQTKYRFAKASSCETAFAYLKLCTEAQEITDKNPSQKDINITGGYQPIRGITHFQAATQSGSNANNTSNVQLFNVRKLSQ